MSTILCPDCSAPIDGAASCPACGLALTGPAAAALWQVDQRLAALDGERTGLLAERVRLLQVLRSGEAPAWPAPAPASGPAAAPPPAGAPWPVAAHRPEASPHGVQNTLLTLGTLLLAAAGVVFTAYAYRHLGFTGRALVLLALTAAAAAAPVPLRARGLTASAESLASLAVVLAALDAWAMRRAGFAADVDGRSYAAGSAALLAAGAAAYATVVPVRAARLAAVLLAQLPVPLVLARVEADPPVAAVVLAAQAGVDLLVTAADRLARDVRAMAAALGGVSAVVALALSLDAAAQGDRGAAAGLLALAVLLAGASLGVTERVVSGLLAAGSVLLLTGAAWALVHPELTDPQQPLVPVAVALLVLQAAALLPVARREGPVLGALAVAALAVLAEAEPVLQAVAGPVTWLADPWSSRAAAARDAVLVDTRWTGTVVTLVVLLAAAGCAVSAGAALARLREAVLPAAVLLVLAVVVLPLGLATGYRTALALDVTLGAVLVAAGVLLLGRARLLALALAGAGGTVVLLAAAWSTAQEGSSLVVLPVAAVLAAAAAVALPGTATAVATTLATALTGAAVAAHGTSAGLDRAQVGALLLVVPAVALGASALLGRAFRLALEGSAGVLAATAVVLAAVDPGWLSWTLAASGVLALALAARPDRRPAGIAGALLLAASSWVRLADAGVHAPEPYVLPLAAAALVVGYLRRRREPALGSFPAYGSGLSLALVPSLLQALADTEPTRGLLLLLAAVAVVLAGVRDRLRAPLVVGGAVVVVDALQLLAPYAAALPRWVVLAAAGALLVALGATYEQRLKDAARLRERYHRWA